jgi:plastocyanin
VGVTAAVPVKVAAVAPTCPDRSAAAATVRVDIATFAFCPAVLTVSVGTDVEWVNADLSPHTVTDEAADTRFDSGPLAQGQSWSTRFAEPGIYRYVCRFHPGMAGTIVVAG